MEQRSYLHSSSYWIIGCKFGSLSNWFSFLYHWMLHSHQSQEKLIELHRMIMIRPYLSKKFKNQKYFLLFFNFYANLCFSGFYQIKKQVIHLCITTTFNKYCIIKQKQLSMTKFLLTLVLICLVHHSISQSVTCSDGFFVTTSPPFSDKGQCTACSPVCKTCDASGCLTYIDKIKGLSNGAPICIAAGAYNTNKDLCDNCLEGCLTCMIDYNVCASCRQGWDFDRKNGQCLRATLGLAAVVLALSVLMLLVGVISCICACKL